MPEIDVGLNAVIVAVTDEVPRILTVPGPPADGRPREDALPFGPLDPDGDNTLDRGLRETWSESLLAAVLPWYAESPVPFESHAGD